MNPSQRQRGQTTTLSLHRAIFTRIDRAGFQIGQIPGQMPIKISQLRELTGKQYPRTEIMASAWVTQTLSKGGGLLGKTARTDRPVTSDPNQRRARGNCVAPSLAARH